MRILVPLRQILDPAGMTVNRKAGRVFLNREDYMMNPASKRALEAALQIVGRWRQTTSTGAGVIVVAFGSDRSGDCLREARALGADRAILIPSDAIDAAGVVRALVALVNHLGRIDLVVDGHRTLDTGISSGAGLSEALGWPYLGEGVDCSVEGKAVRIIRKTDSAGRAYAAFEADLPAVVTVTREGPTPRYAHGGDILTAYRDQNAFERLTPSDLGLSEEDLRPATAERGQSFPPEREFGKHESLEAVVAQIR